MPMPAKLPDVIPISDLEQDAASVLQRLRESGSPTIITQAGRAAAVLIDFETFRHAEVESQILALWARGDRGSAEGAGHDLDEGLAEEAARDRAGLLARKYGGEVFSVQDELRLEALTERVRTLLPLVSAKNRQTLADISTRLDGVEENTRQIRRKHGLAD